MDALGKACEMTAQAVGKIETGKSKAPNPVNLFKLARVLRVDPEWLITGQDTGNLDFGSDPRTHMVPVVAMKDLSKRADQELKEESWIPLPPDTLPSPSLMGARVEGDSMSNPGDPERHFPPGSYIYVDLNDQAVESGDLVVAYLTQSRVVTFKEYRFDDGNTYLNPLNTRYPLVHEEFKIIGKVIGKYEFRAISRR